MKTVVYNLTPEKGAISEQTINSVVKVEFTHKLEANVHSSESGSHLIPGWALIKID